MSLISMKRSFIDLRKCFSSQPKKGPPHSHPTPVLFQSELRFNVTSSELIEIVHRLFASPLCIFHSQLVATRTLALSHPIWLMCFAFFSHCGSSPPPPPLPHLPLSFSFSLLCFLLGCASDLTVRGRTLTPERFALFTQT